MRRTVVIAAVMLLALSVSARGDAVIAADGKSDYTIVIPDDASPQLRFAAEELARYVQTSNGVSLPIRRAGEATGGHVIRLREGAGAQGDPALMIGEDLKQVSVTVRQGYALYGVYQLLDMLGFRWLAPRFEHYKESAELVPQAKQLVLTRHAVATIPRPG